MPTTHIAPTRPGAVRSTDVLSYGEAAEVTGVSADTIERDRKNGRYPKVEGVSVGRRRAATRSTLLRYIVATDPSQVAFASTGLDAR